MQHILYILLLLIGVTVLAFVYICKHHIASRKNRVLALQLAEALKHKQTRPTSEEDGFIQGDFSEEEQLFQRINDVIVREQLYLDPAFGRQAIIERFQLPKDRVSAAFSHSGHNSISNYVQQQRLEHAAMLLIKQPELSIVQVASDSGFTRHNYFSLCFRRHFGMSPTVFRENALRLKE